MMRFPCIELLAATALLAGPAFALPPWLLTPENLDTLARRSPAALTAPLTTVVEGETLPGGDPHDYVSYARYWWPDPDKPGGLPFIRRDGQHNREQVARGDRHRIDHLTGAVVPLAAAWSLHRDEAAARRAGDWLRAWFIAPDTRMNPNIEYGQVQPGRNGNRGNPTGLLDTRDFARIVDALRLLDGSPALDAGETAVLRAWFNAYLDWFTTAEIAVAERTAVNNHGSWYFAQAIPFARYLARDDLARTLCEESRALIAHQIRADGSQPDEIERVDGLGYSRFNLEAQFQVVRLAAGIGVDLWNYTAPNGASLRRALDFLRPYNAAPSSWPHSQHETLAPGFLDELIRQAVEFDRLLPGK